ncbi:MAG TPA: tetratricopeptide repeat protein [Steroidobacteraceae bacterium]|nr:tetratricopeptide repeat protein [Steroidobacteraceae bacterium]
MRAGYLLMGATVAVLAGCVMFEPPVETPPPPPARSPVPSYPERPGAVAVVPAPPPPTASEAPPVPGENLPQPGAPPARQFRLGAAAQALVNEAHAQAGAGDSQLAISTVERALRIEPDNPLLWIELGEMHESSGQYEQAGDMGRKALQLAIGDPHAQSAAWRLIAESLKARGRNGEAEEAESRANQLAVR